MLTLFQHTVAGHYKRDKASFDETARQWAVQYAGAPGSDGGPDNGGNEASATQSKAEQANLSQKDVDKFVGLGFDEASVSSRIAVPTTANR
jgi:hypothetical protein